MNDDAELIRSILRGDTDRFAELVRRHQARVFGILGRYERGAHTAEDLAQETFLKAWRALPQFDGRSPFEHWISVIAVRVALDHLRREKRRADEVALPELGDDALEWLRHAGDDVEPGRRDAAELLEAALRKLSPEDRLVLTLQEIEGRSVKEIAALTGWSSIATRVRALRARGRLRRALEALEIVPPKKADHE